MHALLALNSADLAAADLAMAAPPVWQLLAVGGLTLFSVVTVGLGVMTATRNRKEAQTLRARISGGEAAAVEGPGNPTQDKLVEGLNRLGDLVSKGRVSRNLVEYLGKAGFHSRSAPAIFLGSKVFLLLIASSSMAAIVINSDLGVPMMVNCILLAGGLASFTPNILISRLRNKRATQIKRYLPDAVDLLEICMSAGMGLDQAWNSVGDELRRVSPVLSDEMELTNLEIQLGVPRHQAMRSMAERTGADDISSLVALMIQSDRFGVSVVDAFRSFAGSMREASSRNAEESAEKMSVKMMGPMVLFIFPTLMIVMLGPAVLQLLTHLN